MNKTYTPTVRNPHEREEELQWARILTSGDPRLGMAIVMIQKLCTAVHEFEPAYRTGALYDREAAHWRKRIGQRIETVLDLLRANTLETLRGVDTLHAIATRLEMTTTLGEIAKLAEPIHDCNHTLIDALERRR